MNQLPNVRLVRCPRCRELLPEPTDVPFYKCGGCDIILQARHYNNANERRNSEGSDSVQNNEVGEASRSNPSLFTDPKEGINQRNAEHGNLEPPGVSNSSREAFSSSEQQPLSSSAQHYLERKEETGQNFEVTNTFREDSSLNESSSPSHEVSSTLVPETGEVEGEVEQCGGSIASSSNESLEQPAQLVSLVSENGEVRLDEIVAEDQLEAADARSEAASSEATTARPDGEADELNQNVSINCRLEQTGVATFLSEALLSNEPSHYETNDTSQVAADEGQVEENSTKVKEQPEVSDSSSEPILSNEPTVGEDELSSQLGSPNEEVMTTVQCVYSNTETSSNKSIFHESKELSQLATESQDIDEGEIQNELGISNEDPGEIISSSEVNSIVPDESAIVLPEAEKTSGSILSIKSVDADDGPADGSNSVPALKTTKEAELLSVVDRSQKTMETNPTEKIKKEKAAETTEVDDARFESGPSYRDLPKFPTRSSSAYYGSVSSYDGNDDQVTHQIPSGTIQGINKTENLADEDRKQYRSGRSTTSRDSAFQRKLDNLQAMPEERNPPVMLTEIKMPEVLSDAPYRRKGMRPWTQEFPSSGPMYRRSPERRRHGSSGHLVHREYYNHPIYHPPYQYSDVESRFTRQSDVDGRMISEAVWMGEEFRMYPYPESSGEIYPHPRHQMYYHGTRRSEYQPPVHSIARVPYSGETVRSSGYMRWPSHLPPPDVSYGRGLYGHREPFDSYAASPQVFYDSDYYSEDQRHRNQRTRRNSQPVQHFQPIGGAAPFITCYDCLELLQLPSDFLVFKGIKIHRVKCSACSKVLRFTLEKGCHLVRHVPKPMASGSDKLLKSASTSQANHDHEALHRRSASAQVSLRSSSQALERPKSNKHFQDKGKSVMVGMHRHNSNAQGSSSPDIPRNAKVTWKLPDRSNSPLHRLMGYSSPSAVLYGYGSDELETEDYSRKGNDFIQRSDI